MFFGARRSTPHLRPHWREGCVVRGSWSWPTAGSEEKRMVKRAVAVGAVLGLGAIALACGSPTIQPNTMGDGGGGSYVTPPPPIPGVDSGTPETAGIAPSCTNVDPAKMPPSALVSIPAGTFMM